MSLLNLFGSVRGSSASVVPPKQTATIYNFEANTLKHQPFNFNELRGKVVLIVNVASFCGLTPQYKGLQTLYDTYKDQGLEIIGFPSNQFASQEPGDADAIGTFCSRSYGVTFRIMEKIDVNGDKAHPLYQFLKKEKAGLLGFEGIKWNFEKFLIRRNGTVYERYLPTTTPEAMVKDIEKLLSETYTEEAPSEPKAALPASTEANLVQTSA